jgi:hypothetical protein
MARTTVTRSIVIKPASTLTDFLKNGYATTGVAIGSLLSLSSIYPSPSLLRLANLQTNISKRSQRAGARSPIASDTSTVSVDSHSLQDSEHAFQVVVFKKLTNQLVPKGIDSELLVNFFSSQFTFGNAKERNEFEAATKYQIATPNYHVLCITALVYDPVQRS